MAKLKTAKDSEIHDILRRNYDEDQIPESLGGTLSKEAAHKRRLIEERPEMMRVWKEEEQYAQEDVAPIQAVRDLQFKMMTDSERDSLIASGYDEDWYHFGEEDASGETSEDVLQSVSPSQGSPITTTEEEEWEILDPDEDNEKSSSVERDEKVEKIVTSEAPAASSREDGSLRVALKQAAVSAEPLRALPRTACPMQQIGEEQEARLGCLVRRCAAEVVERAAFASAWSLETLIQFVWAVALLLVNAAKVLVIRDK
eukprot:CAMPEP_0181342682 /NCGR_PEP_ID=MMETSP1101-20121128/31141_1 /TAXON_ID=46948 /ORGANISM="Rhodomonas abbreviata, Strain Caron Lab Isolate" /LENGTH=256 /DNA_ID=CAMNT_0023454177 /DNA_START=190 /DNA_END=960 /DNA_ORIENTATION=+